MLPKWIVDVLDRELPNLKGGERDRIAEALYEAATSSPAVTGAIVEAITSSAHTVLKQRGISDGAADLARELGRNCAHGVVYALGEA